MCICVNILEIRDSKDCLKLNASFNDRRKPEYQKKRSTIRVQNQQIQSTCNSGSVIPRDTLVQSEQKNCFPANKKKLIKRLGLFRCLINCWSLWRKPTIDKTWYDRSWFALWQMDLTLQLERVSSGWMPSRNFGLKNLTSGNIRYQTSTKTGSTLNLFKKLAKTMADANHRFQPSHEPTSKVLDQIKRKTIFWRKTRNNSSNK